VKDRGEKEGGGGGGPRQPPQNGPGEVAKTPQEVGPGAKKPSGTGGPSVAGDETAPTDTSERRTGASETETGGLPRKQPESETRTVASPRLPVRETVTVATSPCDRARKRARELAQAWASRVASLQATLDIYTTLPQGFGILASASARTRGGPAEIAHDLLVKAKGWLQYVRRIWGLIERESDPSKRTRHDRCNYFEDLDLAADMFRATQPASEALAQFAFYLARAAAVRLARQSSNYVTTKNPAGSRLEDRYLRVASAFRNVIEEVNTGSEASFGDLDEAYGVEEDITSGDEFQDDEKWMFGPDGALADAALNLAIDLLTGGARAIARRLARKAEAALAAAEAASIAERRAILAANKVAGAAFEKAVGEELRATHEVVYGQITIQTKSGTKMRIDFVTRDGEKLGLVEAKSSLTARLTKNQAKAIPEILREGGVVVGRGKPGLPGGTIIPPGTITKIRDPGGIRF